MFQVSALLLVAQLSLAIAQLSLAKTPSNNDQNFPPVPNVGNGRSPRRLHDSARPAIYQTGDARSGCPGRWPMNTDLIAKTFIVHSPSVVVLTGHSIRYASGRHDMVLFLNGAAKDYTLTYTDNKQWEDAWVHWIGEVEAGTYKASIQGTTANVWGCGSVWGDLDVLVVPKFPGVAAYQVADRRSGCPAAARANTDLIAKEISVDTESVVLVTGHMISKSSSFLSLVVDGAFRDRSLIISTTQWWDFRNKIKWDDGVVHWTGVLQPGTHKFSLRGSTVNTWGCGHNWGDMDILVLPKVMTGASAYQVVDTRLGCPPAAAGGTDLIKKVFTVPQTGAFVDVTGHMVRRAAGQSDFSLYVDGSIVDRSLGYTPSIQWKDFQAHWIGELTPGTHTVSLRSNQANQWGCYSDWGDIDVLVLPNVPIKPTCTLPEKYVLMLPNPSHTYALPPKDCPLYRKKGDGQCDDANNNQACEYDGGDCCTTTVKGGVVKKESKFCTACKCIEPWGTWRETLQQKCKYTGYMVTKKCKQDLNSFYPKNIGQECDEELTEMETRCMYNELTENDQCRADPNSKNFKIIDCNSLPESMNGPNHPRGCPGAVYSDGSPSSWYCSGGYNLLYPWWATCCRFDKKQNKCVPNEAASTHHSTGGGTNHAKRRRLHIQGTLWGRWEPFGFGGSIHVCFS